MASATAFAARSAARARCSMVDTCRGSIHRPVTCFSSRSTERRRPSRPSENFQSREGPRMKRCPSITALVAFFVVLFVVLASLVTSPVVALEDTPVSGQVTTKKKTALKAAPNAQAAAATMVDANTDLRWVMGQRKGKYVRVMIPKGPSGWVLEADVNKVAEADLASIALEAHAEPCVSPKTLSACTTTKPTGCSAPGSAHGLVNQLKRAVPPQQTP